MKDNIGVHASHCCKWHGCKYSDPDCPVVLGEVKQEYLCEWCHKELENEDYYKQQLKNLEEIKQFDFEKKNNLFDMRPLFEAAKENNVEHTVLASEPEYIAYWKDIKGYSIGNYNNEDLLKPRTIEITGCERIILKDKSLNFSFELTKGKIEDFDEIIVNGIKFKKENHYD